MRSLPLSRALPLLVVLFAATLSAIELPPPTNVDLNDEAIDKQIDFVASEFGRIQERLEDDYEAILEVHNLQKQMRLDFEKKCFEDRRAFLERLKGVRLDKRMAALTSFNQREVANRRRFAADMHQRLKEQRLILQRRLRRDPVPAPTPGPRPR